MKYLIIVLSAMLAFTGSVSAQNNPDPTPLTMQTSNTDIYDLNFNSSKYTFGWNWASEGRKMDQLFDINYYHAAVSPKGDAIYNSKEKRSEIPVKTPYEIALKPPFGLWGTKKRPNFNNSPKSDSCYRKGDDAARWLINIDGLTSGSGNLVFFNAPAITYFPSTNLNPDGTWVTDIPYSNDNSGSVFGFTFKQNIQDDGNYVRLNANTSAAMDNTAFISYSNDRNNAVLRDVYPNNKYYTINNISFNRKMFNEADIIDWYKPSNKPAFSISSDQACGTQNRLTVNLKVNETLLPNGAYDPNGDDVVLRLRIRYTTFKGEEAYIKFSKSTRGAITTTKKDFRGNVLGFTRADRDLDDKPEFFDITRNMLKANQASNNYGITLSAFFEHKYGTKKVYNPNTGEDIEVPVYTILDPNPEFAFERYPDDQGGERKEMIKEYDIEVYYNPKVSVGIRYVRMGSQNSYRLFWGEYDAWIQEALTNVENAFNKNTYNSEYQTKIHRIYANDEFDDNYWAANRYYNKLMGGNVITERGYAGNIKEFNHCLEFKELWTGGNPVVHGYVNNPYIREYIPNQGYADFMNNKYAPYVPELNLHPFGFTGGYLSNSFGNSTNGRESTYESFYPDENQMPVNPFDHIQDWGQYGEGNYGANDYIWKSGTLINFEFFYHACYFNSRQLIFGSRPYWANIWLHSTWDNYKIPNEEKFMHLANEFSNRIPTGEEAKYIINLPVILGAKGSIIWWKSTGVEYWNVPLKGSYYENDVKHTTDLDNFKIYHEVYGMAPGDYWYKNNENVGATANLTGYDLLRHSELGEDFIGDDNPPTSYQSNTYYPNKMLYNTEPSTHSQYESIYPMDDFYTPAELESLGVKSDYSRFYLGSTSVRSELYKNRQFILANEEKLMKLKLKFYRYKGFLANDMKEDNFDNEFYSKIFDFVKLTDIKNIATGLNKDNDVKTRPLTRPSGGTKDYEQEYETDGKFAKIGIDSGFYDITILEEDGVPKEKGFVLSVANRRTSPLIYDVADPDNPNFQDDEEALNALKFYSSDEFDRGCQYGNVGGRNQAWWKKQIYKQEGCREILVPINNIPQEGKHLVVKVRELGIGTELDNKWWRGKDFMSLVDTVFNFTYEDTDLQNLSINYFREKQKCLISNFIIQI